MSVISGSIIVQSTIKETLADTSSRTGTLEVPLSFKNTTTYTDGKTAGKAEKAYYNEYALASTTLDINLSTMVCNDGTTGMAYIREILVSNEADAEGEDLVVGLGTNPFPGDMGGTTPTITVRAGTTKRIFSKPLGATGLAVSTNVTLRLNSGSNSISGVVEILGHNA